jgi:hypothetical protein
MIILPFTRAGFIPFANVTQELYRQHFVDCGLKNYYSIKIMFISGLNL